MLDAYRLACQNMQGLRNGDLIRIRDQRTARDKFRDLLRCTFLSEPLPKFIFQVVETEGEIGPIKHLIPYDPGQRASHNSRAFSMRDVGFDH
jgi:hypothetical protein